MKQLNVLGCVPALLNVLMELAEHAEGFERFAILHNLEVALDADFQPLAHWQISEHQPDELPENLDEHSMFALSVVGMKSKRAVFEHFSDMLNFRREQFPNLVHPTAYVSPSVRLSQGLQLEPLSVISACAELGFAITVKRSCSIGHHVHLADYVTLNPGVVLSSKVRVGARSMLGTGTVVKDGVTIGKNTLIGAGSVVLKDMPDNVVAFGNPCRVQRELEA